MEVITMSSKGQFVVPKEIREEMNLQKQDKFVIVNSGNNILLKRIEEDEIRKNMFKLMDKISDRVKEAGITKKDVELEIRKARESK